LILLKNIFIAKTPRLNGYEGLTGQAQI